MSLGGIALAVGMLVDNAVVVLESIVRKQEHGIDRLEAARLGTAEVAMAVTAATLTSVAVFFPMVFITGIAGQLFKDQSLTVTFALLFSLLVALTLVPMLAAGRRAEATGRERRQPRASPWVASRAALSHGASPALAACWPAGSRAALQRSCCSPLVNVTQAVNRWADREVSRPRSRWALDAPGQGDRRRGARCSLLTMLLILPRLGTRADPADVAGRIQRRPASAGRHAARGRPTAPCRARSVPSARARQRRARLRRRRHGQPSRREPGRLRREHRPAQHHAREWRGSRGRGARDGRHAQRAASSMPGVQYQFSRPSAVQRSRRRSRS